MLELIAEPLLAWYEEHARVLPWRSEPAPYRVWVSEIMLQQTRVEAVKPFYTRFMEALPDVKSLAECPEDKLLKLWEGLGYYNRVRNMQKAAVTVMEEYGGELPADYEKLLGLCGIGSYTAGAIASIAYGIAVPAVDGNVLRVISRLEASCEDILKQSVKKKTEEALKAVMPREQAGDFNQALMELGATVCVPNGTALCRECPLQEICQAREQGIVDQLPVKKAKKARRLEERTIIVIMDGEKAAIRKRPARGLLGGMYELPNLEGHLSEEEVLEYVKSKDLIPVRIQELEESKHIFSHIEWRMVGYLVRVAEIWKAENTDWMFVEPDKTEAEYALPAAFGAYTKYMNVRIGQEKY